MNSMDKLVAVKQLPEMIFLSLFCPAFEPPQEFGTLTAVDIPDRRNFDKFVAYMEWNQHVCGLVALCLNCCAHHRYLEGRRYTSWQNRVCILRPLSVKSDEHHRLLEYRDTSLREALNDPPHAAEGHSASFP